MTSGDSPFKSCIGKASYKDKEHARYAAGARNRESGVKITAYKCRFCEGWHIGHSKRGKR